MAAVLLDRDGVINENLEDYVTQWEDFRFLPGSVAAMTLLRSCGFRLAVVTNQSAVGRGLLARETLDEIHRQMQAACAANKASIEAVFACPHAPWDGCDCRKPRPGLLVSAMAALGEPAEACIAIGDSLSDLMAAEAVGVPFVLVRTGKGEETLERFGRANAKLTVAQDLWEAGEALRAHVELRAGLRAA